MITPNGGVFGRNPKFNNVTVEGDLAVSGGMTSTPNDVAPTSNVTIGPSAGAGLLADATDNICIGSGAGDLLGASSNNIAIGTNSLGAFSAGAASITTSAAGSGGTPGTYDVTLEKDSGTGTFTTYPTVRVTVAAGGTVVANPTILTPGTGATVASGLIMRAVSYPAGLPTAWRGTLASVHGSNVAIGHHAGLLQSGSSNNVVIGTQAGDALTTGSSNTLVGRAAGSAMTTGGDNVAVGISSLTSLTTAARATAVGHSSGSNITNGLQSVFVGSNAAREIAAGGACTSATQSVFVGYQAFPANNGQTNQVVIAGIDGRGDGSNTTVLNNSSTTSTRIAGTATSVLRVDGDTVRVANARTIANSGDAGNEGDICWDANYLYVCVAANTWKRVAIATWP